MIFRASGLSRETLDKEELNRDQRAAKHFGPCGLGERAIYLNSFFIDRRYYIPYTAISRVFKRVAMSKGGFTHRGIFATIPYLVVEYDGGLQRQFIFKDERRVDELMQRLASLRPEIRLVSEAQERKRAEEESRRAEEKAPEITEEAERELKRLVSARQYLELRAELSEELGSSARALRVFLNTAPSYRWIALFITILGLSAFIYGVAGLVQKRAGFDIYFVLFGMAIVFLFSSSRMLPTARNNKRALKKRASEAEKALEDYISGYRDFPLPARYAHPVVIRRMERAIGNAHASDSDSALRYIKSELMRLNSSVTVEQWEYDEVVEIKPMFLNADYA